MKMAAAFAGRWVYVIMLASVVAFFLTALVRGRRPARAGPAVVAWGLPEYALRPVVLKGDDATPGEIVAEIRAQAGVAVEVLTPARDWKEPGRGPVAGTHTVRDLVAFLAARGDTIAEWERDRLVLGPADVVLSPVRWEVRVYPVGDLITATHFFLFNETYVGRMEELRLMIREFVPMALPGDNVDRYQLTERNGRLVITATPATHERIAGFLSALRRK
jgi:hypothetical protein